MADMIQPVRARYDPNGSGAFQLAKALGALNTEGLAQNAAGIAAAQAAEDRKAAETYANSMTVDELGKRIKDGSMLPSQSPTFIAALQHIHGENAQNTFERDTLSKLQTGELKFGSQEELDKYLTEHRNETLSGASKYTIAGYDKGYGSFREKVFNANTQLINQQAVDQGIQEASDNLGNVLLQVTQPGFKGDPAQELVNRYQLLRKTSLLRDDAAKEALGGLITSIASSGNKDLAESVLNKQLDNGVSVRAVLGDTKVATLLLHADQQNDKAQRQRVDVEMRPFIDKADKGELDAKELEAWAAKNEKYVTTSTLHSITNLNRAAQERAQRALDKARMEAAAETSVANATQAVHASVAAGAFAFLPQQKIVTPTGEVKDLDMKKVAQAKITDDVARSKMSVEQATQYWATNNVENPEWQREIQAGASNIASVGWTYDGKNIGQLNPQGQKAIETFMRINATHPAYAAKLVGSEKDYKMLSDIQFLMERGGFPNVSDAASLVNQANRTGIEKGDYHTISKKIDDAVDEVVNPGFWSKRVSWFNGLFGNDQTNLTAVRSDIRRRAELLVMSGQVPDAAAAVKATTEYLANPAVTTNVNNTLYFNKDLPAVPKGEEPKHWMERFIKEVPGQLAKNDKRFGDVRLEPNQYGGFTAWIGGVPLTDKDHNVVTYTKDQVSQWIDGSYKADMHKAADEHNFKAFQDRIVKEQSKRVVAGEYNVLKTYGSREAYDFYLKNGLANKPLSELKKAYDQWKPPAPKWEPFKN